MAAPLLLRGIQLHGVRLITRILVQPSRKFSISAAYDSKKPEEEVSSSDQIRTLWKMLYRPLKYQKWDDPDYRRWKDKEVEILHDIEPIVSFVKDILHSRRYKDGAQLTVEDGKLVVEKLLVYHPHSEDKIGCGLDSIMVGRHPEFTRSRCLFVVRTDGGWIDFSYRKCVEAYIRDKYQSYGERFIGEYFKRGIPGMIILRD